MAAAEDNPNGEYEIEWTSKPLGFSIVMDTTGRNAYVSSIQKQENLTKGLKLAAQIIRINGVDAKQKKHGAILDLIKGATLPMTLTFQPRSFATGAGEKKEDNSLPVSMLLAGAPPAAQNRVDGIFTMVKNKMVNGRNIWQRKDNEDDPIILWYWPLTGGEKGPSNMAENLWMISRKSQMNTQNAYACCPTNKPNPINIKAIWKVYNKTSGDFDECELKIMDSVNADQIGDA